jgi:hypothetical protein
MELKGLFPNDYDYDDDDDDDDELMMMMVVVVVICNTFTNLKSLSYCVQHTFPGFNLQLYFHVHFSNHLGLEATLSLSRFINRVFLL